MSDYLSFVARKKKNVTTLDLHGKIIGSRAFTLKEEILRLKDSGVSNIILNFQEVTSIDSLGVMAIVSSLEAGVFVKIINLSSTCRQILEQNRAANLIPIFGSEEDAIGNLSKPEVFSKELRRSNRITTNIPIEILVDDFKQRGILLNISEGGALVGYLDPISPEPYTLKQLSITMDIPLLGAIELEGKPVRFGRNSEMLTIGIELFSTEKSQKLVKQVNKADTPPSTRSFY